MASTDIPERDALAPGPERIALAPDFDIARILTGLWQVADMEKDGPLDTEQAARALVDYADAGFDSFDMADHYGSAELIAGAARRALIARDGASAARLLTKWCPGPLETSPEQVRAGIAKRAERLGVDRIDLLQLHWWTFEHAGYLDVLDALVKLKEEGLIAHIGLTNFDTAHLHLLLTEGYPILSNQVCCSLLDRRALGQMGDLCLKHGVHLLTYGTLAGGFLSERWLGRPEPADIADMSKQKYKRFIGLAGGWEAFQGLLTTLKGVADRHGVSLSNVAARWVLEAPAVAAVIVGARLSESEHRADNAGLFRFSLSEEDRAAIDEALGGLADMPGDCGQEYRKPPFLTATGDLSDHLDSLPAPFPTGPLGNKTVASSGSRWEAEVGYSRAVRIGDRICVSGTTATHGDGRIVCHGDPAGQTVYILDKIAGAIRSLGGSLEDVVRTRIYVCDRTKWEGAGRIHGEYFGDIRPANTLVEISGLVGEYEIEIEAEAVVP